jgi:LysR family transcriptional regulator, nod-box dependent transcriptional activator
MLLDTLSLSPRLAQQRPAAAPEHEDRPTAVTKERRRALDPLSRSLRASNLNLLPVLHAALKHQNLTHAAQELNISQSAVSNSLKQLREHFGDELLVKDGHRLRLTKKGAELIEPLERFLAAAQDVVGSSRFDPSTATAKFRIATADYITAISAPLITSTLRREAPQVSVQMVTARGRSVDDLRVDKIEMIIAPWKVAEPVLFGDDQFGHEFAFEHIGSEPFVCMAHKDDEDFRRGLTVEQYLARPHGSFYLDIGFHGSLEHNYLFQQGLRQFDQIQTSDFTILPLIASRTDCIVLTPRSVARLVAGVLPVQIGPCPLPIPDLDLVMLWNARRGMDPDIQWLKALVKRSIVDWLTGADDPERMGA